MTVFDSKSFPNDKFFQILAKYILVWIWIRITAVYSENLNPDPDSAKYLDKDPDSVNTDLKHCHKFQ
jgi:hypothetical protein